MKTFTDIQFDQNLFSQCTNQTVTLYQLNEGANLFIPLTDIDALTFIRHFDEIISCQDWIRNHPQNIFTLITYSDNIQTWLWNKHSIPDNVDQIIIFCLSSEDRNYFKLWIKRYTQKVKDVITFNDLPRELLIIGIKYIDELYSNFKDDADILQLLRAQQRKISLALANIFEQIETTNDNK